MADVTKSGPTRDLVVTRVFDVPVVQVWQARPRTSRGMCAT